MPTKKNFLTFIALALISIFVWIKFTYPQVAFINLSVDNRQAGQIARNYLQQERHVDLADYKQAVQFASARSADQYLQKTLGYWGEQKFFKQHNFELFYWIVRFYKENEKEQYFLTLSAATGEVTGFSHEIKEAEARPNRNEEESKEKAISFLQKKFAFDPTQYELKTNLTNKHDNRTNYTFAWEKKGVFVRWSTDKDSGGAKLRIGATISGDEILSFYKQNLEIPDEFNRYVARKMTVGTNLAILFRIAFFSLLTAAIFFVMVRRNNLVMHSVKRFCIALTAATFIFQIAGYLNNFERVLYAYDTTSSFASYLWRSVTDYFLDSFIITLTILMPCLAGEALRQEVFPQKRSSSFLRYLLSSFYSRSVAGLICLGYLVAMIMIGLQALAFEIGQRHLGVWVEYSWMTQLSSSYWPFLNAFLLGFIASTSEEISYRLFAINLGKKFLKSTVLAVIIASVIWGYGHSTYMVFPMWFRGIEVTCLGLFLSYIYLRYGIITTIVAHYLFNVFWESAPYLLGKSTVFDFYGCLAVLLLPLGVAAFSYYRNQPEGESPLRWRLNLHQKFNLAVLENYLKTHPELLAKPRSELTQEIMNHGWDLAVVELALEKFKK